MKSLIVSDLDAIARKALVTGSLANLSLDLHVAPLCHPDSAMTNTRAYEGDVMMFSCAACNKFVFNLKIAKE